MSFSRSASILRRWLPADPILADELARLGVTVAQLELSVRPHAGGLRADRVMIERARPAVFHALRSSFSVPETEVLRRWLRRGAELGLPLIAGFDATRGCAKLYLNGSDASRSCRRALARLVGAGPPAAPHVIGLNLFANGSNETKLYAQSGVGVACEGPGEALRRRAGALAAGTVGCTDERGAPVATFVALRPASAEALDRAFGHLPGFGAAALAEALPAPATSPRSLGISAADPERWTAYVKPKGTQEPELWALEPAVKVRARSCEVHVFVHPLSACLRAYAAVGDLAFSYRVAAGEVHGQGIAALMRWVAAQLERNADRTAAWSAPPAPWVRLSL